MNIVLLDSEYWQKVEPARRDEMSDAVQQAAGHASGVLGDLLSNHVNVLVHPEAPGNVIPETGEGGWTHNSEIIRLYFDPNFPHGYDEYLGQLAHTTHHELHHAARYHSAPDDGRLIAGAINEGMATVFEREVSGSKPLWGMYESDDVMAQWTQEIIDGGTDWSKWDGLAFTHPDSRRWVAYKTGTWIIDRAIEKSGHSVLDLTAMDVDEILKLAQI